jgi:hypothetical protein
MNKIFGEPKLIKRLTDAKPGDKTIYVNLDAIRQLPDEYEALISEVTFNPSNLKESFSDVGNGNLMPNPDLMYRIAEAKGISGGDKQISVPMVEDIDINPMLMKRMDDPPTMRKTTIGRSVTKFSTCLQEDGTVIRSSACNCEFNVWDRCVELWEAETAKTNGYDPSVVKKADNGNGFVETEWYDRASKTTKKGQYWLKYETAFKRKAHFVAELKFAHSKAETKSHLKTIRELASLMTGYKAEDLASGSLVFARVRRSKDMIKAEAAARLSAIAGGVQQAQIESPYEAPASPQQPLTVTIVPEPEPVQDLRQTFIGNLEVYLLQSLVPADLVEVAGKIKDWLNGHADAVQDAWWPEAVKRLKAIEDRIPAELRIGHRIY